MTYVHLDLQYKDTFEQPCSVMLCLPRGVCLIEADMMFVLAIWAGAKC